MLVPPTSAAPFRRVDAPEKMSCGMSGLLATQGTVFTTGTAALTMPLWPSSKRAAANPIRVRVALTSV